VEGSRRFHILRSWDQDGYRVAEVEWLQDIPLPEGSQQKRELIELANGASELTRAYIRRARETVRTGMLIFSLLSTSHFELVILYSYGYRKVKSCMQIFGMMHESLAL